MTNRFPPDAGILAGLVSVDELQLQTVDVLDAPLIDAFLRNLPLAPDEYQVDGTVWGFSSGHVRDRTQSANLHSDYYADSPRAHARDVAQNLYINV